MRESVVPHSTDDFSDRDVREERSEESFEPDGVWERKPDGDAAADHRHRKWERARRESPLDRACADMAWDAPEADDCADDETRSFIEMWIASLGNRQERDDDRSAADSEESAEETTNRADEDRDDERGGVHDDSNVGRWSVWFASESSNDREKRAALRN